MKKNVTINDTLKERLERVKDATKDELIEFIKLNPKLIKIKGEIITPDLDNDLDYSGTIHQIVDSAVPIYDQEIKDLWYLYDQDFESAYKNAGVGELGEEGSNWRAAAIYFYLLQELREWYERHAHDITKTTFNKLNRKKLTKCLETSSKDKTLDLPY